MHVVGEEGLGAFVTVTFRGNVQQRIGRGNLKSALVALILHPESGSGAPAVLVTEGEGPVGETLRRTKSEQVAVLREGRRLHFMILGPGFGGVERLEVKTFARASTPATRSTAGESDKFELMVESVGLDVRLLRPEFDNFFAKMELSCDELEGLERRLNDQIRLARMKEAQAAAPNDFEARDAIAEALQYYTAALERAVDETRRKCQTGGPPPATPTVVGVLDWNPFTGNPNEVTGIGRFTEEIMRASRPRRIARVAVTSLDAMRIVIPGSRTITAYLCPSQLPVGSLSETNRPADTLTCTGGTLQTGQQFTLNVRMNPAPAAGMGGQLYGRPAGGDFQGPFQITGP